MSVQRYDLNRCIGCRNCTEVCPMDVFRFNEDVNKSVIAYPENCQTCGQCFVYCMGHSLAISGEGFAYPLTSTRSASVLNMNRQLYVAHTPKNKVIMPAIAGVLGAMAVHNALLWRGKVTEKRAQVPAHEMVERMSLSQRLQHMLMLVAFLCLVFTGFGMRYFGSWFEHTLGFGTHAFSLVHRTAGLLLAAAGLFHLGYLAFTREGRKLVVDIFPKLRDGFDLLGALRYYVGLGGQKPRFARFTYAEKAEYWFLVLGTVSMTITGSMMWAWMTAGRILSPWWVSLARALHVYEAILASLTIVIWHFYQVFFDPGVAPANLAWLDGKMPAEQYRHEHPLDAQAQPDGPLANDSDQVR